MAILSAIFSLLTQQIGTLVRAVFGWSITGLFGRLPSSKQTALSAALVLSLAWPILVLGVPFPAVASWALAFVPLHDFVSKTVLRFVWLGLALLAPLAVGAIVRWVAGEQRVKTSRWKLVLHGYPLTLGMCVAFFVTLFVVPALKVATLAKGWTDEHVYVQVREGAYRAVLDDIAEACRLAGIAVREREVPEIMSLPTRVLTRIARGKLAPIVAEEPRMLAGDQIELHLYPADLLLRGRSDLVSHARSALARALVRAPAHLVESDVGQAIEDELGRMWGVVERHQREGFAPGSTARARVREIAAELDRVDLPFDQWVLLYTNLNRLERAITGAPTLVDPQPAEPRPRTSRRPRPLVDLTPERTSS